MVDEICIEQQRTHSLYLNILSDVIRLDVTARYGTATRCIFWSSHHVLNVRNSLYTRLDDCRSSRMKELVERNEEGTSIHSEPQAMSDCDMVGAKREERCNFLLRDDSSKPKD